MTLPGDGFRTLSAIYFAIASDIVLLEFIWQVIKFLVVRRIKETFGCKNAQSKKDNPFGVKYAFSLISALTLQTNQSLMEIFKVAIEYIICCHFSRENGRFHRDYRCTMTF